MLQAGHHLGHYQILGLLGRGGMGEVYRGHDPRLGRDVAIKILPADLSADSDAVARFELEARAVSSLNHPAVVTIYDVGTEAVDGRHVSFMAMEVVEGRTLRESLSEISTADLLRIAEEIAAGLAAAHEAGIVHRDLKPDNIMLRADGRPKILDFGLAKLLAATKGAAADSDASTVRQLPASQQTILGTVGYMAPEQVEGRAVDARADVFSLGCILYEAFAGAHPFRRESAVQTLYAITHHDPFPMTIARADAPPEIAAIVQRCLARNPEDRYPTMREVERELSLVRSPRPARRLQPRLTQITFSRGVEAFPAWSPDGTRLAFAREAGDVRRLFIKDLDSGDERALTSSDRDEIQPAWSPDGRTILFVRSRSTGRMEPGDVFGRYDGGIDIWSLDLAAGTERLLLRDAINPSWSPDGSRIAFDASWGGPHRIWVANARGQNPMQVTTDDSEAVDHLRPRWSPDGRLIVFQNLETTKFDIRTVDLQSGTLRWITDDAIQDVEPVWCPTGHYIYFSSYRSGGINLWRLRVNFEGAAAGPLEQITTGAGQDVHAAIAGDGQRIAFATLRQNANIWRLPLDPVSGLRAGAPESVIETTREDSRGAWSPDGMHIAFNSNRSGPMNLWLRDLVSGADRQLTRGEGGDFQPNWSPDQQKIAFFSGRNGQVAIWEVVVASNEIRQLTGGRSIDINPFYSPDGQRIAYQSDADGRLELWVMRADGSEPRQLTNCGIVGHFVRWSPDGRWIFFRSAERPAVPVMRIGAEGGEPEVVAGIAGGSHISFNPSGTTILDVLNHKSLWVSPIDGSGSTEVFHFEDSESRIDYPVWSPDGRWGLFDRFVPHGGDIWTIEGF